MANTQKLRNKLMNKLTELFQLDQPDLDFGFYRIMQAKSAQVTSFIDKDLLKIIEDAFGQVDENRKAELQANIQKEIEAAKEYGVADPESSPKVLAAKAKYDALKDGATAEADVYDHLYRFFERYYDQGDFISRRYYARENAGKAAPFAIPYNGEEVKLHWANADQYYVKTAEYFSNFTFDLAKAKEVVDNQKSVAPLDIPESLKVHFRIVDASEGEHGNVKAAEDKKRFFILHDENPVEFNEADELVVNFEYKSLPGGSNDVDADTEKALKDKFGKSLIKGVMPNLAIAEKIIAAAGAIEKAKKYLGVMGLLAPTDKIVNRPLLAKYINQYTARNTCDYFIHKDLSGFLKRELEFYIKNEVMHLDDIENADVPTVENYLAKLKVIRKIATKLIDFIAQLENFQKKLWLKKKFITETNYCVTLDRVPEELYAEIAANEAQREEWVKLFAIDEISATDGDLVKGSAPGYSIPLTVEFLKANNKLVLDTAFFSSDFKEKLIGSIESFDEQCDGLLIHSENFQALNLLQERYREQVNCVYIDPPYNTGEGDFLYKDSYQHSSWLTMIQNRIQVMLPYINSTGRFFCSIDDRENANLIHLLKSEFGDENYLGSITWEKRTKSQNTKTAKYMLQSKVEYIHPFSLNKKRQEFNLEVLGRKHYPEYSERFGYFRYAKMEVSTAFKRAHDTGSMVYEIEGISPGVNKSWQMGKETVNQLQREGRLVIRDDWPYIIYTAEHEDVEKHKPFWSHFFDKDAYGTAESGAKVLSVDLGFGNEFKTVKPLELMKKIIFHSTDESATVMDFFAGSGTTAHALINLNRECNGKRFYIIAEMGEYFEKYTKPRIIKAIYALDWNSGKPSLRNTGLSQCFKYLRLESYEDTLNNLVFGDNSVRNQSIDSNAALKEDYMLRYLLNVETRGSQSLLNIDAFSDPTAYSLVVKKPGSDEQVTRNIDLVETFNYLLGLRLEHMAAPQTFTASFTRNPDPELPEDQHTKLVVDGKIQQASDGKWWFRKLEGWVPADPMSPNNGKKEKVLIVWRKLTGNLEEDNLMLDEWFKKYQISSRESAEFDVIYVNGSNNLPNLKKDEEHWKVRLIEEEFHKLMWSVEGEI